MVRNILKRLILWCLADKAPAVARDDRGYSERTWRHTRVLALIALALSVVATIGAVFFTLTIWTVNNEFVAKNPKFKFDEGFDAVAAAASVGRLDMVAMTLTLIAVIAAFALIYGWTAFRSVAIDAAKSETKERLPIELRALMDSDGDRWVGVALQDAELLAKIQQGLTAVGLSDTENADQVDADADWTEEENGDEQRDRTAPKVSPANPGERRGSGRKPWLDRLLPGRSK